MCSIPPRTQSGRRSRGWAHTRRRITHTTGGLCAPACRPPRHRLRPGQCARRGFVLGADAPTRSAAGRAIGAAETWIDAWAVSFLPTTVNGTLRTSRTFENQTLRLNVFAKLGGRQARVRVHEPVHRRAARDRRRAYRDADARRGHRPCDGSRTHLRRTGDGHDSGRRGAAGATRSRWRSRSTPTWRSASSFRVRTGRRGSIATGLKTSYVGTGDLTAAPSFPAGAAPAQGTPTGRRPDHRPGLSRFWPAGAGSRQHPRHRHARRLHYRRRGLGHRCQRILARRAVDAPAETRRRHARRRHQHGHRLEPLRLGGSGGPDRDEALRGGRARPAQRDARDHHGGHQRHQLRARGAGRRSSTRTRRPSPVPTPGASRCSWRRCCRSRTP